MITGSGYQTQALQSLGYYLQNTQYQHDGSAKTLLTAYTNLNVTVGFPDSLERMELPTLAIMQGPTGEQEQTFGGNTGIRTVPLTFSIYGFAGGQQTDGANMYLRDQLCNDVRELLEDTDYVDLYTYPSFTSRVGNMSVENVTSRFIQPVGTTNADKYRFVIDVECEVAKST